MIQQTQNHRPLVIIFHRSDSAWRPAEPAWLWEFLRFPSWVMIMSHDRVRFPEVRIRKGTEIGLHFPEFLCISLHFSEISLHFSSVLYISLHFFTFLWISLYFQHFSEFLYISQHFFTFFCISLYFCAFLCISLHFKTKWFQFKSQPPPRPTY